MVRRTAMGVISLNNGASKVNIIFEEINIPRKIYIFVRLIAKFYKYK
jgi:hypothetical protein